MFSYLGFTVGPIFRSFTPIDSNPPRWIRHCLNCSCSMESIRVAKTFCIVSKCCSCDMLRWLLRCVMNDHQRRFITGEQISRWLGKPIVTTCRVSVVTASGAWLSTTSTTMTSNQRISVIVGHQTRVAATWPRPKTTQAQFTEVWPMKMTGRRQDVDCF